MHHEQRVPRVAPGERGEHFAPITAPWVRERSSQCSRCMGSSPATGVITWVLFCFPRPVNVGGPREGGFLQVEGVEPGERIVMRGAHLVRLAALSPQTPGHGHVH